MPSVIMLQFAPFFQILKGIENLFGSTIARGAFLS